MLRLITCAVLAMSSNAIGQDLDGVCRLSSVGKQWSGVAISDDKILTVAHHGLNPGDTIRADFGIGSHGSFERVSLKAKLIKSDVRKDLSVLEYSRSSFAVKCYPIGQECSKGDVVLIAGYIHDEAMQLQCPLTSLDTEVEMIKVLEFRGQGVSGMSGAPVLFDGHTAGVQFGGGSAVINAVTVEAIREFLEGR
jgi:hypothetical protein